MFLQKLIARKKSTCTTHRSCSYLTCLIISLFLLFNFNHRSYSQTFTVTHDIPYATTNQYMWGPNGSNWSLDTAFSLFQQTWNESWGFDEIANIFGTQWGVAFNASTWGLLGSTFTIQGFSSGSVDVNYPVRIYMNFPANNSFNPGQMVTISSSYDVLPGWALDTHFPPVGSITLDIDFGMGANMDLIACLGSCDTFHIIPPINIPVDSITIFHVSGDPQDTMIYPCWDSIIGFHFCHDTMLPIHFPDWWNIGLTGEITVPFVITTDTLIDKCLYASGDSSYLHFNLDILQFLSAMAGFIPDPTGSNIQQYIGYLNDTITLDVGFTINIIYSLLTAEMNMNSALHQDFTFCAELFTTYTFPTSLQYSVTDPANNDELISSGTNDTMTVKVGNDLNLHYPCSGYPTMSIGTSHFMHNDFTNHTWDSISFDLVITALTVHINIPTFKALPSVEIPEFCIQTDDGKICSPSYSHPPVFSTPQAGGNGDQDSTDYMDIMDIDWQIGPLFQWNIPLGSIPFTWFNETWELQGFNTAPLFPNTLIVPNPELYASLQVDNVMCFGENTGVFTVHANYGTPPYTFQWSTGAVHTQISANDSVIGGAGTYSVTITDFNGCSTQVTGSIINAYLPLAVSLTGYDLLCYGDNTGYITSNVTGGAQVYNYHWSPTLPNVANPINLSIGTYYLTLTDAVGCTETAMVTINQPPYMDVLITGTQIVHCNGSCNGEAIVNASGGTQPYICGWSTGDTTFHLTDLCVGQYQVTVADLHGCDTALTATVTDPSSMTLTVKPGNVSCHSFCDGNIEVVMNQGIPPYTFYWNDGQTTNPADSLCPGLYTVTVMSGDSCLRMTEYEVTQPDTLIGSLTQPAPVICKGDSVLISAGATGGTTPYTYAWSNTVSDQNSIWVTAGTYSLTIADHNRCVDYKNITVTEPALIVFNPSVTVTNCIQSCNGVAGVQPEGGVPPYYYHWSTGATTSFISHLCAEQYYVTLTDSLGCIKNQSYTVGIYPYPPTLDATVDDNSIFSGRSTILHATEIQSYSYIWTPAYALDDHHSENPVASPRQTTTYTVQITDSVGCTNLDTITIFVNEVLCAEPYIFIPNAFSPNGDGKNDVLKAESDITDDIYFAVYDRWGKAVFETTNIHDGWDGAYKGEALAPAVFVYYFKAKCINNKTFEKKGNVTLIR
ncbi:MAG: gliding motility-associated C-terminal domain-containing protein [Bacteroidia bacterium]|nr:gliding motility-associated C-terminal domain-containing protein [Bacteroidia bacterium]